MLYIGGGIFKKFQRTPGGRKVNRWIDYVNTGGYNKQFQPKNTGSTLARRNIDDRVMTEYNSKAKAKKIKSGMFIVRLIVKFIGEYIFYARKIV